MASSEGHRVDHPAADCAENPARADANTRFDGAVLSLLGHRADLAERIQTLISDHPQFVRARLLRGHLRRMLGRRDQLELIQADLAALDEVDQEERSHPLSAVLGASLAGFLAGGALAAARELEIGARAMPGQPLLGKLEHAYRFIAGDLPGMLRQAERLSATIGCAPPTTRGYLMGCMAFAYEEQGFARSARSLAERALEIQPDDVWAAHALAHVHFEALQPAAGLSELVSRRRHWSALGNFAGHLAWHEALFRLQLGDVEAARQLLRAEIDVYPERDYRDVSNALSLCVLLERAGYREVDIYDSLAAKAEFHAGDHLCGFADLHYALALLLADRRTDAMRFVASARRAASLGADEEPSRRALGRALGALLDAALGRRRAAQREALSIQALQPLGGSRAQRRVALMALEVFQRRQDAKWHVAAARASSSMPIELRSRAIL